MAELLLYMAKSGSGKSSSLRNLPPDETILITPNTKSLPFPGGDVKYTAEKQNRIITNKLNGDPRLPDTDLRHYPIKDLLKIISEHKPDIHFVVIDDFTHFFSARIFSPEFMARTQGNEAFQRYTDFGADVYNALFENSGELREDLYIIVLHHTQIKDDGMEGFKTVGKLLDNAIDVPSYFNYIFHGVVEDSESGPKYLMQTNKTKQRHAKSPYGVFSEDELYVPNDMLEVIKRIEAYKKGDVEVEWK